MPTKPAQRITAWSYSRYSDWKLCPLKAKLKHVEKIREPDNAAQARGSLVHKEAEGWSTKKREVRIEGAGPVIKLSRIPDSLRCFEKEFAALRKIHNQLETEAQVGFASDWSHTEWFDSDARRRGLPLPWCRVTMDLRYRVPSRRGPRTVKIVDYKTGKVRPEHLEQLSLYAVAGLALDEEAERIETELWYLDQGQINPPGCNGEPVVYLRSDEEKLRADWEARVAPMLADCQFKAKPNDLCRFCHYRKSNKAAGGGQCKF